MTFERESAALQDKRDQRIEEFEKTSLSKALSASRDVFDQLNQDILDNVPRRDRVDYSRLDRLVAEHEKDEQQALEVGHDSLNDSERGSGLVTAFFGV